MPTSLARAAFFPPVLCCLPWRLLPFAAAGLRLLSPFSSLFTLRLSWPATQPFSSLFDLLFWPFVAVCLVLSGLSSVWLVCFGAVPVVSQLAPSFTHTRHHDFLPPLAHLLKVGLPCFVCLGCPVALSLARLSCSVRGVGNSRPEPWTRLHCSE